MGIEVSGTYVSCRKHGTSSNFTTRDTLKEGLNIICPKNHNDNQQSAVIYFDGGYVSQTVQKVSNNNFPKLTLKDFI